MPVQTLVNFEKEVDKVFWGPESASSKMATKAGTILIEMLLIYPSLTPTMASEETCATSICSRTSL